jgi:hypothetical protein
MPLTDIQPGRKSWSRLIMKHYYAFECKYFWSPTLKHVLFGVQIGREGLSSDSAATVEEIEESNEVGCCNGGSRYGCVGDTLSIVGKIAAISDPIIYRELNIVS